MMKKSLITGKTYRDDETMETILADVEKHPLFFPMERTEKYWIIGLWQTKKDAIENPTMPDDFAIAEIDSGLAVSIRKAEDVLLSRYLRIVPDDTEADDLSGKETETEKADTTVINVPKKASAIRRKVKVEMLGTPPEVEQAISEAKVKAAELPNTGSDETKKDTATTGDVKSDSTAAAAAVADLFGGIDADGLFSETTDDPFDMGGTLPELDFL